MLLNETLQKVVFQLDGQLQKDQEYYLNVTNLEKPMLVFLLDPILRTDKYETFGTLSDDLHRRERSEKTCCNHADGSN